MIINAILFLSAPFRWEFVTLHRRLQRIQINPQDKSLLTSFYCLQYLPFSRGEYKVNRIDSFHARTALNSTYSIAIVIQCLPYFAAEYFLT